MLITTTTTAPSLALALTPIEVITVPDELAASMRQVFDALPAWYRGESFEAYVIETIKDAVYGRPNPNA